MFSFSAVSLINLDVAEQIFPVTLLGVESGHYKASNLVSPILHSLMLINVNTESIPIRYNYVHFTFGKMDPQNLKLFRLGLACPVS